MNNPCITDRLDMEIATCFPKWRASTPVAIASGLEATVFRAETKLHGPLALKVFINRWIQNDNDSGIDARDLLNQDYLTSKHLADHGVPATKVIALHFGFIDFLAYSFVETDSGPLSSLEIGRVLRQLHALEPPSFVPVAHRGRPQFQGVAADLIASRIAVVRQKAGENLPILSRGDLEESLALGSSQRRYLHMDVRPENLLCRNGQIKALIDWSNAIVAHPIFEFARMAEYGLDMEQVVAGYGSNPLAQVPLATATAARIYTAAMLAVVHLSEAPDPQQSDIAVARLKALMTQFLEERP